MNTNKFEGEQKLVKQVHLSRPDWNFFQMEPSKEIIDGLLKPPIFDKACDKACTKVMKSKPIVIFLMLAVAFIFGTDAYGIDAADVTYNQGSAGAEIRTVQEKLQESVSVTDFGAKGDGVTDDTEAVKAAIAASSRVFFPPGLYYVTETINLTKPTILYGETGTRGGARLSFNPKVRRQHRGYSCTWGHYECR